MIKPGLIVLAVWLAFAGLSGAMGVLQAGPKQVDETAQSGSPSSNSAESPALPSWLALCSRSSGTVDTDKYHAIRDRLSARVKSPEALAQIDAAVVQAEHDCSSSRQSADSGLVVALMELLAGNWKEQGNFARADQLYGQAYAIVENLEKPTLDEMGILQDWANMKLAMGERQRAEELTRLRTAVARKEYESGKAPIDFSTETLIDALQFQAAVFKKIGLASQARSAKQEAEKLSAEQKPCQGVCGEPTREDK